MYTKKLITDLIIDTFDIQQKPNPYSIGSELGKKQGSRFIDYLQECGFIVKPAITEILMELHFPNVTAEHVDFKHIKDSCYNEFLAGAVKSKDTA